MKVGFTGTRQGLAREQLAGLGGVVTSLKGVLEWHHGGAIGADASFHRMVRSRAAGTIHLHPCNIPSQQANTEDLCDDLANCVVAEIKPPLVRNRDIVDAVDMLLACPAGKEEELRSGTWATIRYARKCGKRIIFVWPDGTSTEEG